MKYLTGNFPHSVEATGFFMAMFGAMTVANGKNKDRKMAWFHALFLSGLVGYGGAIFTPWMLGNKIPLFINDFNTAMIFVAFYLVNFTPFYSVFSSFPGRLSTTMLSTLFKALGVRTFCTLAFTAAQGKPSQFGYDIMIVGPILYPTLLGNMGPLFVNGLDLLKNGMPFPFQQSLFTATFYHFYVHDQTGVIGTTIRSAIGSVPGLTLGLSEKDFGLFVVSFIMHANAILKMPEFFGPSFNPFGPIANILTKIFQMNNYYGSEQKVEVPKKGAKEKSS